MVDQSDSQTSFVGFDVEWLIKFLLSNDCVDEGGLQVNVQASVQLAFQSIRQLIIEVR